MNVKVVNSQYNSQENTTDSITTITIRIMPHTYKKPSLSG